MKSLERSRGLVIFFVLAAWLAITWPQWLVSPAPGYQVAAQLVHDGQFDARVYDDQWYGQQVRLYTHSEFSDVYSPDLPTLALLLWPLAVIPSSILSIVWSVAQLAALFVSIRATVVALNRNNFFTDWSLVAVSLVVWLSAPLQENLSRGQIYLFILLLHALVLWAVLTDRDRFAGIMLGLLFVIKIKGWPIWVVLIALRRWRVLRWAVVSLICTVLISIVIWGADIWQVYFTQALPAGLQSPIAMVPAYQTVMGWTEHLFRLDPVWNPLPLIDLPLLAVLGSSGITIALLAITWFQSRRIPIEYALGAAIVLSVILSPLAEQYHFLILSVPLILLASNWMRMTWLARIGLVFSIGLSALPLPYKSPQVSTGVISLLAYPRLYGAVIAWILLIDPRTAIELVAVNG